MRYVVRMAMLALAMITATLPAQADGEEYPPIPDAEEIITACNKVLNENLDASIPARLGSVETATLCIENAIKENLNILLDDDALHNRPGSLEQRLQNLRQAISFFYNDIYSSGKACRPSCGNIWVGASDGEVLEFYEKMLRTIIWLRNDRE